MRWINVKDRLPKVNEEVLTYDGTNMLVEYIVNCGTYFTWSCSSLEDVTHWTPLPSPPPKKEE